jgi:hypothetical protein
MARDVLAFGTADELAPLEQAASRNAATRPGTAPQQRRDDGDLWSAPISTGATAAQTADAFFATVPGTARLWTTKPCATRWWVCCDG